MKAFELIPADRGVILLMEDGSRCPRSRRRADGKNEQIVLSKSILNEVVTNRQVLSSDATMDSGSRPRTPSSCRASARR